jgi:hypothetical protein
VEGIMMNAIEQIESVRKLCLERYEDMKSPIYGDFPTKAIVFMSKTLSSRDYATYTRDNDQFIAIISTGWVKYEFEFTISGTGAPHRLEENSKVSMSDNELESYLNGPDCNMYEVQRFIEKYNEIANLPDTGLKKIDVFM